MRTGIGLIALGQLICWSGLYYIFPAMLLKWEHTFGWQRSEVTFALTLAIIVSALTAPLAGQLIDRDHGRILLSLSSLLGGFLLLALAWVETIWLFYLVWLLIGLCMAGCLYEPCFALLIRMLQQDARRAISLITLVAGFAGSLTFPGVHLLTEHFDISTVVVFFALLVILIAAPSHWCGGGRIQRYNAMHQSTNHTPEQPAPGRLRSPRFLLLAGAFALLGLVHSTVLSHLLPMLTESNVNDSTAVLLIALIGPMQVVGRVASMALERHVPMSTLTAYCFSGAILALICLMAGLKWLPLLFLFVLLQGSSHGILNILKPLVCRDLLGTTGFGRISGAMALPYLISFAVAPLFGALVWQHFSYFILLCCLLLAALLGFSFYVIVSKYTTGLNEITCEQHHEPSIHQSRGPSG